MQNRVQIIRAGTPARKGHRRREDIPADLLAALEGGEIETATLVEQLAIDCERLLRQVFPGLHVTAFAAMAGARPLGITRRMALAGRLLAEHLGAAALEEAAGHRSDTVRGWAAFALADRPAPGLTVRLARLRPLADDAHFGVREWAWMALRPHLAVEDLGTAIGHLLPWVVDPSPRLRRFASEVTRPRGVWAVHLPALVQAPWIALPLLEPLRADAERYVQDSVANWLNDAARSQPEWVRALCERWAREADCESTRRIVRRARRNLPQD